MTRHLCAGLLALLHALPALAGSFTIIDPVAGQSVTSAYAVSADGSTVVGVSSGSSARAIRWTASGGTEDLGDLAGSPGGNSAFAVSADGSVVAGYAGAGGHAFRWTAATGMVDIGRPAGCDAASLSQAFGISGDGSVIAGYACNRPFRWDAGNGATELPVLGGFPTGSANAVSSDGAYVVGYSQSPDGPQATRWSAAGPLGLGFLAVNEETGEGDSRAAAVSADGNVIVGWGVSGPTRPSTDQGLQAFRWTADGGMVGIAGDGSRAYGVSADGNVVVGQAQVEIAPGVPFQGAFIWTPDGGLRSLLDVLVEQGVTGLDGWWLSSARGISADGLTITGYGFSRTNPVGQRAWVATLNPVPVPAVGWLIGCALGVLGVRAVARRRALDGAMINANLTA